LRIAGGRSTIVGLPRLPRHEFDRPYLERLIAGDPETERHFTRYFGDLLSLKLRSRLRSREQIEDAKQETFARVLTSLKRKSGVKSPEALGAFVNSVCNNVVFEMYRSGSRTVALEEDFDAADDRQPGADSAIAAGESRERVRAALVALPQKERDLLTWLFFEGRDKDQVCRDLDVDRDYLRVLLHRAKNRFREQFTQQETE
jgi:RNA polymerase sigma-70 factor, ECF subfamily